MKLIFKLFFKKLSTSNHSAYFSWEGSGYGVGFGWGNRYSNEMNDNSGHGDNAYYCTERYNYAEGCGVEPLDNDKLSLIDEGNNRINLCRNKNTGIY